jgi:hypothetical protein
MGALHASMAVYAAFCRQATVDARRYGYLTATALAVLSCGTRTMTSVCHVGCTPHCQD